MRHRPRHRLADPHRQSRCPLLLDAAIHLLAGMALLLPNSLAAEDREQFFETLIRPIFIEHCLDCHRGDAPEGGLSLENQDHWLRGGDSGPATIPGQPEASTLIAAIEYRDREMPPGGKLTQPEIDSLRQWVEDGAYWPSATRLTRVHGKTITAEERNHWAFRPIAAPPPPMLEDPSWVREELDRFVAAAQQRRGTTPAPPADPATLLRRLHFDLTGLPPSPETLQRFLENHSEQAFEQLVDRLLASPEFGERWASFWLDSVRYAESDGYKQDSFRPTAWRYRDYVIQAFREDRPFDQFLTEQLAGDLLSPVTPEGLAATGYLRAWIYEYNQRDVVGQWQTILDDLTETTADAFLGIGLGCARCHDHKYDPLLQLDYYRLQACFTGLLPDDDVPLLSQQDRQSLLESRQRFLAEHTRLQEQLETLEAPIRREVEAAEIEKFPPHLRPHLSADVETLGPLERQWVALARRQIDTAIGNIDFSKRLSGDEAERWKQTRASWDAVRDQLPQAPATLGVCELPNAPGQWSYRDLPPVAPGRPVVLTAETTSPDFPIGTPRRLALAQWITADENPLVARVIVNRAWTRLFGEGLVASTQDFGSLTPPPAQPELLDFLAHRFREDGWSFRRLIRGIVLSSTYRQSSDHPEQVRMTNVDPLVSSWWRSRRRRLDAEQIRDSLLWVSQELRSMPAGPSHPSDSPVRSVYLQVLRNTPDPILATFDFPDRIRSRTRRDVTITPQQALLLMNHPWVADRSKATAEQVASLAATDESRAIDWLYRRVLSRPASTLEFTEIAQWIAERRANRNNRENAETEELADWTDLCHALLNSSEFLHLD